MRRKDVPAARKTVDSFAGLMTTEATDLGINATISDDYADFTDGASGTFTFVLSWEEVATMTLVAVREFGWFRWLRETLRAKEQTR